VGGGGDVVGALAVAEHARALGTAAMVGGTTWERRPIDPRPGPRRLAEVAGARALNAAVALAGPDTRGPGGFRFAEAHMARVLGEPVVLVDPNPGPAEVADGLAEACAALGCDLVVLVDVGGDVLAHGDEPGLASPLCDALLLAAAPALAARVDVLGAVFGAGCDGELRPDEVLARLAEVAAAGGLLGAAWISPRAAQRVAAAVAAVPTEASAQALACARGALGPAPIRGGRRTVQRSPLGALTFYFDPLLALAGPAPLARAVIGARDLREARDRLARRGVSTELDLEEAAAAAG